MSCIITYNGQNFTQEDFLDYLKSQIPVSQPQQSNSKVQTWKGFWTRKDVENNPDKVFLFGDNFEDAQNGYVPSSTQAVIRGLPNAIGISTKNNRGTNEGIMDRDDYQESSYLDNQDFEVFKKHVDNQIEKAINSGKTIVLPENGIGTGAAQLEKRAPKLFAYLQQELDKLKQENKSVKLPSSYKGIPIIEGPITTLKNTPVAARYRKSEGVIYADLIQIQEKFKNKAWTNPALQRDGSYATALNADQFNTLEDFTKFILEHEFAHSHIFKREGETVGQYEDRINQEALKQTFLQENSKNPQNNTVKQLESTTPNLQELLGKPTTLLSMSIGQVGYDKLGNKYEVISRKDKYGRSLEYRINDTIEKNFNPLIVSKLTQSNYYNEDAFEKLYPKSIKELEISKRQVTPISQQNQSSQFVYKDIAIPTQFQLGEQQEEALRSIIDFVNDESNNSEEPFFTLQGFAGTGKTTIIGYVQKYFEASKRIIDFRYIAPTHAATAQLAITTSKLGNTLMPSTVRSSVYESKDPATGVISYNIARKLKVGRFAYPIFIVDETSMLSQKDLDLLLNTVKRIKGKIIFMGDNKQIPEVIAGSNQVKNMNSAFQTDNTIVLDKVYRQSSSDLLDTLTDIRNKNHFDPVVKITNNDGTLQVLEKDKYNDSIIQDFQNDLENTVYIAYTNNAVSQFNKDIKQILNGETEPIIGEKIVGYLGLANKTIEDGNIANSISYIIKDIQKIYPELSIYSITAFSDMLDNLKKLGVKGVRGEAHALYAQLSSEDSFQFDGVTNEIMEATNKQISANISKLYKEHLEILAMRNSPEKWAILGKNKDSIQIELSRYEFGNSYVFDPEKEKLVLTSLMDPKKYTKVLKDTFTVEKGIDYGYGITAHKAQGMTVNNAYVDLENISRYASETPIMVKGEKVNTEKNALYYVAMSRAKNKVVLEKGNLDTKTKNETNTEKKIEPIKPQSKDFITNKVNSNFDKYGYVDILTSGKNNFDFKSAVIKYILKDLGLEFKSDKELNSYLIKEKNEGRTFNLMQYVTLEELPDNKTRVKLNKRNLLLDSVEDFKPKSLGGLNFTSSGRDFESKNIFKNNIEQAFNCK